jgi:hypothetical protein
MKIKWTHEALDRLMEVETYIIKDNPEPAYKFVNVIIRSHQRNVASQTPFGKKGARNFRSQHEGTHFQKISNCVQTE